MASQGDRDARIPRSLVEGTAGILRRLGFDVRLKVYDEEDHYLLYSQAVLGEILEFMTAACELSPRLPGQPTAGPATRK